jgi:hypothetical protein
LIDTLEVFDYEWKRFFKKWKNRKTRN